MIQSPLHGWLSTVVSQLAVRPNRQVARKKNVQVLQMETLDARALPAVMVPPPCDEPPVECIKCCDPTPPKDCNKPEVPWNCKPSNPCDNGTNGKGTGSKGKGSKCKTSNGKGSNGSKGKGSKCKTSNGKGSNGSKGKGSKCKTSNGKGSNGSKGKGSNGKGSKGKCVVAPKPCTPKPVDCLKKIVDVCKPKTPAKKC